MGIKWWWWGEKNDNITPVTIGIIEFKDGLEVDLTPEVLHERIGSLIRENITSLELLPEGNYNVTPSWWKKHTHNHHLTVLDNGNGVYRMTPRESGVGFLASDTREYSSGGTNVKLPEDQNVAVVAGPSINRRMSICSIIVHFDLPNLSR